MITLSVSYDVFTDGFLNKITEYEFSELLSEVREEIIDGYMKRVISQFRKVCKYNLSTTGDDNTREFDIEIPDDDLYEIVDIVSEGMVEQWLKPYVFHQANLELVINTRDFSTYSPAELLKRTGETHAQAHKNFTNMLREYSYVHGDLTNLHL